MSHDLPLFPLNTVLFPGTQLPLRVFELRYRRLVDICGHDKPFIIARIREGREVGSPAFSYDVGTLALITQLQSRPDGSLGVRVQGQQRVRLSNFRVEQDGLLFASVTPLTIDPPLPIPEDLDRLADELRRQGVPVDSAASLGWRLAELLPVSDDFRQDLLEEEQLSVRLACIRDWLNHNHQFFTA